MAIISQHKIFVYVRISPSSMGEGQNFIHVSVKSTHEYLEKPSCWFICLRWFEEKDYRFYVII